MAGLDKLREGIRELGGEEEGVTGELLVGERGRWESEAEKRVFGMGERDHSSSDRTSERDKELNYGVTRN